jgi:hypothetical protein
MYCLLNNFLTDIGCCHEQYIQYHHAIDVVGMIKRVIAGNGGGEISNEHVAPAPSGDDQRNMHQEHFDSNFSHMSVA